jgi:hypothetical protein
MRSQLFLPFLLATTAFAQNSADPKQRALASAKQSAVTLELDLPYANNENPKQAQIGRAHV